MSLYNIKEDECTVLVKAIPHASNNYFETVCCAGVGKDLKWRRLYPVAFRTLTENQKFGRWSKISYKYKEPDKDKRLESQKVDHREIKVIWKITKDQDKLNILNNIIRSSCKQAMSNKETLTVVRPEIIDFKYKKKKDSVIIKEIQKHSNLANQLSFDSHQIKPLNPCPYNFYFRWKDEDGEIHTNVCEDWETSATYFTRLKSESSEKSALDSMIDTFGEHYAKEGCLFAMGTHQRRSQQWLLVGIIKPPKNSPSQMSLF